MPPRYEEKDSDGLHSALASTDEVRMNRNGRIFLRAFLQGFTGAGLFRKLEYPGAPSEFVDSRSSKEALADPATREIVNKAMVQLADQRPRI